MVTPAAAPFQNVRIGLPAKPLKGYLNMPNHGSILCAFGFNFAPLRELYFSQRRKVKTEGAKQG
jgi:hypothetical protein